MAQGTLLGALIGSVSGGIAGGNTAATLTLGKTMFIGGASSGGLKFLSNMGDILIKGEDISIGNLVINNVTAGVMGILFASAGYGLNKAFYERNHFLRRRVVVVRMELLMRIHNLDKVDCHNIMFQKFKN